jgi:1,4-alpha-glucan branching enzyme
VIGDLNSRERDASPLRARTDGSGIREGFIPEVTHGNRYKYPLRSHHRNFEVARGDPFALRWEHPPHTASIVRDPLCSWQDADWMRERASRNALDAPTSIYEFHPGSWRRVREDHDRFPSYREAD